MSKDKPFNIFGKSSRSPHSSKQKTEDFSVSPPSSSFPKKESQENTLVNQDVKNMVDRMRSLHDEIDKKLEDTFQKTGWSSNHIKKYLENPNNFNTQEWERVQRERKALLTSIWKRLGKNIEDVQKVEKMKEGLKASKDRKSKTLGARKNWIPIR